MLSAEQTYLAFSSSGELGLIVRHSTYRFAARDLCFLAGAEVSVVARSRLVTIASHSQPASLSFHRPSEIPSEPLAIDHWLASSLLQKAIRRGDADLAASAALTLFRARGTAIWRRFLVIAFEDVSVGCIEAMCDTVTLATDRSARLAAGDEAAVVACLARRLAYAPKDRSTDYLMGAAQHHPEL